MNFKQRKKSDFPNGKLIHSITVEKDDFISVNLKNGTILHYALS